MRDGSEVWRLERNIQKYEALVAAVEEGNITRAAKRLSFAQSTVSKMIADLEGEWQVRLLERGKDGVRLTQDGRSLMPYIRSLLEASARLEAKVGEVNGLESGQIRIGVFYSVAEQWMPRVIAAFQRDHPNIRYELPTGDYDEIEDWVEEGRVDGGFVHLPTRRTLSAMAIADDPYMVVLPKGHTLCAKAAISPEDLNGEKFLLLERGGRTEVSNFIERYHLEPDVRFTTWDDYAIMAMVEIGQGVALLPSLILRRIAYDIEVRPLEPEFHRTIGLAVKDEGAMSVAMRQFVEYVKREIP